MTPAAPRTFNLADPFEVVAVAAFFFFQAEDGIRDKLVTGVQTCALPISSLARSSRLRASVRSALSGGPLTTSCPVAWASPSWRTMFLMLALGLSSAISPVTANDWASVGG